MPAPELVTSSTRTVGYGMDRKLDKPSVSWPKLLAGIGAAVVMVVLASYYLRTAGVRTFAVAKDRVTIGTVSAGTFRDFIPIRGTVTPLKTVYLDAVDGGRVEAVLAEEGGIVEQGQPILELSNTTLQLDVISREAQVSEQLNNLRNTRLAMEQNRLSLKSELVEINYQLQRLGRLAERRKELFDQGLIAQQDYEDAEDELAYYRARREVTVESQEQDERMRLAQVDSLEDSVERLQRNLTIARSSLESLLIRAPVSGQLTSLNAEIGESKARGERLGQIDDLDNFKVTVQVDEFYVTRVQKGQSAGFPLAGRDFELEVGQVYPEIRDGQFEMDLAFVGMPPLNIRRGQTLQITLALGDASEALLLPRGGFLQSTGGNWAFVLDGSGAAAQRRPVQFGRRNPEHIEVLEGLTAGESVIISDYSTFAEMDRIELND